MFRYEDDTLSSDGTPKMQPIHRQHGRKAHRGKQGWQGGIDTPTKMRDGRDASRVLPEAREAALHVLTKGLRGELASGETEAREVIECLGLKETILEAKEILSRTE
jgi:hypothetical protein